MNIKIKTVFVAAIVAIFVGWGGWVSEGIITFSKLPDNQTCLEKKFDKLETNIDNRLNKFEDKLDEHSKEILDFWKSKFKEVK